MGAGDFCGVLYDIEWNQVIFSNQTIVCLNLLKRHVWHLPGTREVVRTVKNPGKGECVSLLFEQWV